MNVATWLEGHNNSLNSNTVLIYNTFSQSGRDNSEFTQLVSLLKRSKNGFSAEITDRRETPEITDALLENYSQLWIILGETGSTCCFSDQELERIVRFNSDGSSMLIASESGQYGMERDWTAQNMLPSRFGVTFSGHVDHPQELRISSSSYFFRRVADMLRSVYRFMT
jgi:hypothetical protein